MVTIDHAGSLEKVCERLRVLYRAAQEDKTFINLDMEEYRDLALTVDAFKKNPINLEGLKENKPAETKQTSASNNKNIIDFSDLGKKK